MRGDARDHEGGGGREVAVDPEPAEVVGGRGSDAEGRQRSQRTGFSGDSCDCSVVCSRSYFCEHVRAPESMDNSI